MDKKRLQFDFTQEAIDELDHLKEKTGLPTRAELIRHALRFFQWAYDETANHKATLLLEKNDRLREVIFPFWTTGRTETTASEIDEGTKQSKPAEAAYFKAQSAG